VVYRALVGMPLSYAALATSIDCSYDETARPRRPTLRSSLVYAASKEIPNRFQLCQTISKAARVLHLATNPTESTINRVLQNISHPVSELQAEIPKAAL
jgi:hypothetical protein